MHSILFFLSLYFFAPHPDTIGPGRQPRISLDNKEAIRIAYGQGDSIFCAVSGNRGLSFGKPVLVARVPGMHLGMSRGPQIAGSNRFSVITAMDKAGNIHWFRGDNAGGSWKDMGTVNDLKGSAPEGLMGLAADREDNFYAVWLDIRTGNHNQVYFSRLAADATQWSSNALIYQSPDGHVCECCKPNVAVKGSEIAVMFRNWLDGSRDLYLLQSHDAGKSFGKAQKLGEGTWKLNGCPMDGGGLTIDPAGAVHTVWQREGIVYYCRQGQAEQRIARGRICSITCDKDGPVVSFQTGDTLKLNHPKQQNTTLVSNGAFLQSRPLSGGRVLCVWELDGAVRFKSE